MPIRDCVVVAIEGSHASGKTTLVHGLVSYYRERGVHVTSVEEPARTSPFMEDIVVRDRGEFDTVAELDTFAAMLTTQLRAARHHSVLITDKTLMNVVAYARSLLPVADGPVVDAMLSLIGATRSLYDHVFYLSDAFSPWQDGDAWRSQVADQQAAIDVELRRVADQAGISLIQVPRKLTTSQRMQWISGYLADSGLQVFARR